MTNHLFKNKYRTKSTRLPNWDYSTNGYYFITICTENRLPYLGEIVDWKMQLTEIGKIAKRFWLEISNQFLFVQLDKYVVMPNHIHGIVIINNDDCRDVINHVSTQKNKFKSPCGTGSLSEIVRWYKGRCSFEIHKHLPHLPFSWQSRFYDHIIRNDKSLTSVREYIYNNVAKWEEDKYYRNQ